MTDAEADIFANQIVEGIKNRLLDDELVIDGEEWTVDDASPATVCIRALPVASGGTGRSFDVTITADAVES